MLTILSVLLIGFIVEIYYRPRLEATRNRGVFLFYNDRSISKGVRRGRIYLFEL